MTSMADYVGCFGERWVLEIIWVSHAVLFDLSIWIYQIVICVSYEWVDDIDRLPIHLILEC